MTDGDIHNRQSRINNTIKSLKEDNRVSDKDLEVILDFKNYLESQNLSLDRISRYFYSLKFIVRHIDWELDQPDKEKLVALVRDINQDELWDDERADSTKCEYKKLVRKLYKDYLDEKREDLDGEELTGFFTVTAKKSLC